MNRKTCMTEIWDAVLVFNEKYFPGWRGEEEIYLSNALAGEVGEVCNTVKHRVGGGANLSRPSDYELLEELADVFMYMELLIEVRGHDITTFAGVIGEKLKKNRERMEKQRKGEVKEG
jgi:NTP pyrophosphatase (non-canonical NTP hydrolase)